MTVSSTQSKISYAGNGITVSFAFPYYFLANGDLVVTLRDAAGVETVQTITTHYTVTGAGNPAGGTITMLSAPAADATLVIFRDPALTQGTDFVENGALSAETLEMALDRLTMFAQRLAEVDTRSIKFPESDSSALSTFLPSSIDRASRVAAFDANGSPTTLSIAGLGVTVDDTSLVVVAAVAPAHVNGRFWIDTSTANTLIVKLSDGVDWIEQWQVATNSNVFSIPSLVASVAQVVAGIDTTKMVSAGRLSAIYAKGTALASASSLELPASGGGFFHVTGSTTVNGISELNAGGNPINSGFEVTLVFDGALTLDNSATFIQIGGADITTAAGDVYRYRHEGSGTWRCTGFALAGSALGDLSAPATQNTPASTAFVVGSIGVGTTNNRKFKIYEVGEWCSLQESTLVAASEANFPFITYATDFEDFRVRWKLTFSVDGADLQGRTSQDNVAFDSGVSDYRYSAFTRSSANSILSQQAATDDILILNHAGIGSAAGEGCRGYAEFIAPADADHCKYFGFNHIVGTTGISGTSVIDGARLTGVAAQAFRLFPSSGTFSGKVVLEGRRKRS